MKVSLIESGRPGSGLKSTESIPSAMTLAVSAPDLRSESSWLVSCVYWSTGYSRSSWRFLSRNAVSMVSRSSTRSVSSKRSTPASLVWVEWLGTKSDSQTIAASGVTRSPQRNSGATLLKRRRASADSSAGSEMFRRASLPLAIAPRNVAMAAPTIVRSNVANITSTSVNPRLEPCCAVTCQLL